MGFLRSTTRVQIELTRHGESVVHGGRARRRFLAFVKVLSAIAPTSRLSAWRAAQEDEERSKNAPESSNHEEKA